MNNQEAFPKEEHPLGVVRMDDNGTILYNSAKEFVSLPYDFQKLALAQNRIKKFARLSDDIPNLIKELGGEIEVGELLYKREVDDIMSRDASKYIIK